MANIKQSMTIWKFLGIFPKCGKGLCKQGDLKLKLHWLHGKNSPLLRSNSSFLQWILQSNSRELILQWGQSDSRPLAWKNQSLQETVSTRWVSNATGYHSTSSHKATRTPIKVWEPPLWQRTGESCWLVGSKLHLYTNASPSTQVK